MSTQKKVRVLFVCLGNICRSPMAEAVFRHLVEKAGLQNTIEADSAGTGDWHVGQPAHHGTRTILQKNHISYNGRGRQIAHNDLDKFDYIVTMDNENLGDVQRLGKGRAKIEPLLSYAPDASVQEVPDPYYSGGFEGVYQLVQAGAAGLLDTIRREHVL
ncbi:MAG TPA: low molecular weight protein-tyrosine-phosphatase [Abditibacteriaceae bacterium]|jgi:protein-tyrosine phosphatase